MWKRFSIPVAIALLGAAGLPACANTVATTTAGAGPALGLPDDQLAPLSIAQATQAEAFLAKGELVRATDHFEAALAADPRNGRAYIGLARVAEAQQLPGKAVRFYRQALEINPNDLNALELQGNVLLARRAIPRAQANLDRLKKLCATPCPQQQRLAAAIAAAPAAPEKAPSTEAAPEPER